jgi:hypothetical protein
MLGTNVTSLILGRSGVAPFRRWWVKARVWFSPTGKTTFRILGATLSAALLLCVSRGGEETEREAED